MTEVRAVACRAAVLAVSEHVSTDSQGSGSLWAGEKLPVGMKVVVLPTGVSAAALGRGALFVPGSREWTEAGLGDPQVVELDVPAWAFQLLYWAGRERPEGPDAGLPAVPGPLDVPVWADPATAAVVAVDEATMLAELEANKDLAREIWKQEDAPLSGLRSTLRAPKRAKGFLKSLTSEWTSAISELRDDLRGQSPQRPVGTERPTDASHPPLEGTSYRSWVAVKAGLVRDRVHPVHVDAYAAHRGVPTGRWAAADAAWAQRATEDPALAAWSAYDVHRMTPTGTHWDDDPGTAIQP